MGKKEVYGPRLFSVTEQVTMGTNWITWNSTWTLKKVLALSFWFLVLFFQHGSSQSLVQFPQRSSGISALGDNKNQLDMVLADSSTWLCCELGHRLGDFSSDELDDPFQTQGFCDPVVQVSSILPSKLSLNTEKIWAFGKQNYPSKHLCNHSWIMQESWNSQTWGSC